MSLNNLTKSPQDEEQDDESPGTEDEDEDDADIDVDDSDDTSVVSESVDKLDGVPVERKFPLLLLKI